MTRTLVTQFLIQIDLDSYIDLFWDNEAFFESFLSKQLEDLSVQVSSWENVEIKNSNPAQSTHTHTQTITKQRQVRSYHPSRVSFPGLPSHAEVGLHLYHLT
jgi:hypothetical protein